MNERRRSMGGRIYQEKLIPSKPIFFKNPEQRKLIYPTKGDTTFEPREYGRKHLSPKHSAIHSIIFNDNFKDLLEDKEKIVKSSINKKSYQKHPQNNLNETKNIQIQDYVDDFLRREHKSGSFHQKIQKGRLYRQNSINQIFQPYLQRSQITEKSQRQNLFSSRILNKSNLGSSNNTNQTNSPELQIFFGNKDFSRYINPNNLNSAF